jgi:hypothetical protein
VTARNLDGFTQSDTVTVTAIQAPDLITHLTAVCNETFAAFNWTEPFSGGSSIINYGFVIQDTEYVTETN